MKKPTAIRELKRTGRLRQVMGERGLNARMKASELETINNWSTNDVLSKKQSDRRVDPVGEDPGVVGGCFRDRNSGPQTVLHSFMLYLELLEALQAALDKSE